MKAYSLQLTLNFQTTIIINTNLKLLVNLKHLTSKLNKLLFIIRNKLNNVDSSK